MTNPEPVNTQVEAELAAELRALVDEMRRQNGELRETRAVVRRAIRASVAIVVALGVIIVLLGVAGYRYTRESCERWNDTRTGVVVGTKVAVETSADELGLSDDEAAELAERVGTEVAVQPELRLRDCG